MHEKRPPNETILMEMFDDSEKIISFYEDILCRQTAEINSLRRRLKKALRLTLALIRKVRGLCAH